MPARICYVSTARSRVSLAPADLVADCYERPAPIPANPRWNSRVNSPCRANAGAAPAPAVMPVMLTVDSKAVLVVGAKRAAAVVSAEGTAAIAIAGVSFGVTVLGISGIAAHSGSQGSSPSACCSRERSHMKADDGRQPTIRTML